MPYISKEDGRREALRNEERALTAGELNYQIFYHVKHCKIWEFNTALREKIQGFVSQFMGETPNYQKYNDLTGVLIRCYKEVKRRLHIDVPYLLEMLGNLDKEIADYEDKKIEENGDVE